MSMYLGAENVVDTLKNGLNPTLTGIGKNQQFGSGFYFYVSENSAKDQIGQQGLKVIHPVIMSADVDLHNPLKLKHDQTIHDAIVDATPEQVHQILLRNERIFDMFSPLMEWRGVEQHRLSEELIQEVCLHYSSPDNFWKMEKELFGDLGEAKLFRIAVNEVLGYDGVVVDLGAGRENKIAWFEEQASNVQVHKMLPRPELNASIVQPPIQESPTLKQTQNRIH